MKGRRYGGWAAVWVLLCGFIPAGGAGHAASPAPSGQGEDSLLSPLYHYTEGLKSLTIRTDTAAAMRSFARALACDSTYAPAWYELAVIALEENDPGASEFAGRAVAGDTTDRFSLGLYARSLVLGGRLGDAAGAYRRLIRLEPRNPENYRMLALLAQHTGNGREAVAVLDSAEVLFGRNSRLAGIKLHMLMEEGRYDEALEKAGEWIAATPYEPEGYRLLGEIQLARGRDSLGVQALERALELDSTDMETLVTLADYYNRSRDYGRYLNISQRLFENDLLPVEEKVRLFNEFTRDVRFYREYYPQIDMLARTLAVRYPNDSEVTDLYGTHLIASGETEQALALYKRQLAVRPPRYGSYTMVIDIESYLRRPDSVERYLIEAIALFPQEPMLRIREGHAAGALRGRYDRSVESYRKALELVQSDSMRSVVWGFIGDACQQESLGDGETPAEVIFARRDNGRGTWKKWLRKCYDAYDKALRYDRDNVSVLNNYAYFLSLEGRDLSRALEMSSRVLALTENNPTYLDTHAWVLFRLGRLDEAKHYLRQAVSLDGQKSPDLQLHYGDVLAAAGEDFMAETYWKRARENGYDPAEIERRLTELKNRKRP